MKTLSDIEHLQGVNVLVRVDFNVPIEKGAVADDFRIRKAMPTIELLRSKGARLILMSHIENADGAAKSSEPTLSPVANYLAKKGLPAAFIKDIASVRKAIENMNDGDIILLENIRNNLGEKENDKKFAKELASLGDIYVNDAFSVSHREHASICAITSFIPSYAGLQLTQEINQLRAAFSPAHPFVFILGGAKFDTKLPLIERFTKIADTVFIGGALANDALKSLGHPVGTSKVSDGLTDISAIVRKPTVMVPADVSIEGHVIKDIDAVGAGDRILDIGPKTLAMLGDKLKSAKFILWNGPLGLFEEGFTEATEELARMIAGATQNGKNAAGKDEVISIVGGGDTLSSISKLGVEDRFTFVSTGGGAMLDFLATGTLPGIEALERSPE